MKLIISFFFVIVVVSAAENSTDVTTDPSLESQLLQRIKGTTCSLGGPAECATKFCYATKGCKICVDTDFAGQCNNFPRGGLLKGCCPADLRCKICFYDVK